MAKVKTQSSIFQRRMEIVRLRSSQGYFSHFGILPTTTRALLIYPHLLVSLPLVFFNQTYVIIIIIIYLRGIGKMAQFNSSTARDTYFPYTAHYHPVH